MNKTKIAISLAVLFLSGCAQVPGIQGSLGFQGAAISINGVVGRLGGKYNLGGFERLPAVKTQADLVEMGRVAKMYTKISQKRFAEGDFAAAVLANHLAARLAEYQLIIKASNQSMINSIEKSKTGMVFLNPGDLAIMPLGAMPQKPATYRGAFSSWPYGTPAQVAGVGDISGIGKIETAKRDSDGRYWYEQLPVGQIITLESGAVVERSDDSMIFHNPLGRPVEVNISDLGYLPPMAPYSTDRQLASPVIKNIVAEANRIFLRKEASVFSSIFAEPFAPNVIRMDKSYFFDTNGFITNDKREQELSKKAYEKKSSPYRIAVDAAAGIYRSPEWYSIKSACFSGMGGRVILSKVDGESSDRVTVTCLSDRPHPNEEMKPIYSKSFYLGAKGISQTWSSFLKDRDAAQLLKRHDENVDAISNLTQMIPLVGNFESGLKCLDMGSIPGLLSHYHEAVQTTTNARAFVTRIYDVSAEPKNIGAKTLDCASAIPMLNYIIGTGDKAVKASKFADFLGERGVALSKGIGAFETSVLSGNGFKLAGEMIESFGVGKGSALGIAKVTYDGIQTSKNFIDFSNSLQQLLQLL